MMPEPPDTNDFAVQSQEAFSSSMRPDEFEEEGDMDARQGGSVGHQHHRQSAGDDYALLQHGEHEDISQLHPTQPTDPLNGPRNHGLNSPSLGDYNTSYGGAYGRHSPNPVESHGYENPPSYSR